MLRRSNGQFQAIKFAVTPIKSTGFKGLLQQKSYKRVLTFNYLFKVLR